MSKVLVTGGCGFLGSHVCECFKSKGWQVVAYDNLTKFEYARAFKNHEKIRDYNLRFLEDIDVPTIIDDIRNYKMLLKAAKGADLIAHCAAQPAMTVAIENPFLDHSVNVEGTLCVLEAAREVGAAVVNCSTIHIYGNGLNEQLYGVKDRKRLASLEGPIGESHVVLTGKLSPLHASKYSTETYVNAYSDTYNLRAANFRLTGIYGPRQFGGEDHGWVANFTIRTLLGQPIKIFGTDQQVRDILYVRDAANAFLSWFSADRPGGTFNIGGGKECSTSIRELLDTLKVMRGLSSPEELLPPRPGDLWWFISNYGLAKYAFDWEPEVLPTEGVKSLVEWIEKERSLFE